MRSNQPTKLYTTWGSVYLQGSITAANGCHSSWHGALWLWWCHPGPIKGLWFRELPLISTKPYTTWGSAYIQEPSYSWNFMSWKCFLHYWPFVRGIHWSPVDSPHKDNDAELRCFFSAGLNRLLNKQLSCPWLDMAWHSWDVIAMWLLMDWCLLIIMAWRDQGVVSLTFHKLSKIFSRNLCIAEIRTSSENFKLKLCVCAQSHALGTHTKFQLEILTINVISGTVYFCKIILESCRSISETTPRWYQQLLAGEWSISFTYEDASGCCEMLHKPWGPIILPSFTPPGALYTFRAPLLLPMAATHHGMVHYGCDDVILDP